MRAGPLTRAFAARGLTAGRARIAVRPNRIALTERGAPGSIPGTLIKATYVGNRMEYRVETGLGEVFVTSEDVGADFENGAELALVLSDKGPVLVAGEA